MGSDSQASPFAGRFRLLGPDGSEAESSEALFELSPDALQIRPKSGAPVRVDFADLDRLRSADYRAELTLEGGERLEASMLGRRFGEFAESLGAAVRDFQARNLLLSEPEGGECFTGEFAWQDERGPAELRIYATRLAVVPRDSTPFAVSFGELRAVGFDEGRYAIDLQTEGGALSLTKLGKRTLPCLRLLEARIDALKARTATALAALLPGLPTLAARRLAQALPDGVPASRSAIDAVGPDTWRRLLETAVAPELRGCFETLEALCPPGEVAVAIKETNARNDEESAAGSNWPEGEEGGEGDSQDPAAAAQEVGTEEGAGKPDPMAGRVVWFLFPIFHEDRSRPGNAVAVEVVTRSGRATYFFRLAPPEVYREAAPEELRTLARERVRSLSRALVALGFRREPIYLAEEKILSGKWSRYRLALRLSPALKAARAGFLGRAVHGAAWKSQLDRVLASATV